MSRRWKATAASASDDGVIEVVPPTVTNPAGAPTRAELGRATAFRRRFAVIYVGLALVGGAGIGALVVVAASSDAGPKLPAAWSTFVPTGTTNTKSRAIARVVSRRYVGSNGAQITGAIAGPPTWSLNQPEGSTQIVVGTIAVQADIPAGGQLGARDVERVDTSNALQYLLCAYGPQCSIEVDSPSDPRYLLLRREGLELALTTFKYLTHIDSVLVFLPPPFANGQPLAGSVVLYLRRKDLGAQLAKPLAQTLDPRTPGIGEMSAKELALVGRLTQQRLFQTRYTQAQDESAVLLLDPVTAAP